MGTPSFCTLFLIPSSECYFGLQDTNAVQKAQASGRQNCVGSGFRMHERCWFVWQWPCIRAIVAIVAIVAVPVRRYRTAGPSPVQLVSLLKGGTSGVSEL